MNAPQAAERPGSRLFSTRKQTRIKPAAQSMVAHVLMAFSLGAALFVLLLLSLGPMSALMLHVVKALVPWLCPGAQVIDHNVNIGSLVLLTRFGIYAELPTPDWLVLGLHAFVTLGIFSICLMARSMPWRSGLQLLCVLHGIGLIMVGTQGGSFPYSVLTHTQVLFDTSIILLIITPWVLAAGYFLVERSWLNRLAASALILGYQIVAIPLKLIVHLLLISLLSSAAIPLMFFAAGPLLDVLILSALYGWVVTWQPLMQRKA